MKKVEEAPEQKDRFDVLMDEMQERGMGSKTYNPSAKLSIDGKMFTNMVTYNGNISKTLQSMLQKNLAEKSILENMMDNNSQMSVFLMEQHIAFDKAGKTISGEEMDALDAKKKIVKL